MLWKRNGKSAPDRLVVPFPVVTLVSARKLDATVAGRSFNKSKYEVDLLKRLSTRDVWVSARLRHVWGRFLSSSIPLRNYEMGFLAVVFVSRPVLVCSCKQVVSWKPDATSVIRRHAWSQHVDGDRDDDSPFFLPELPPRQSRRVDPSALMTSGKYPKVVGASEYITSPRHGSDPFLQGTISSNKSAVAASPGQFLHGDSRDIPVH